MHGSRNYGSKVRAKGLLRDHADHRRLLACSPRLTTAKPVLPGEWDLRKKAAPCGNQLVCGSCWALSITGALRSFEMLKGTDPGPLSPNYLLLNQGPIRGNGCNGGDFNAGDNCTEGRGPCLESLSPYTGSMYGLSYPTNAPVAASASRWMVVGCQGQRPTPQELCEALWGNGTGAVLCADIAADGTLENYANGVITRTTSLAVNHMVRLVGYHAGASIDENGNARFTPDGVWADPRGAYFIMRNTWDLDWGIEGDAFVGYGVNNLAETAMLFA